MTRLSRIDSYPSTAVKCDLFVLVENKKRCGISLFTTWPRNVCTKGWLHLSKRINIYVHAISQDIYLIFTPLYYQCFMDISWNCRCAEVSIPLLKTFHPIVSYICRNCSKKLLRMCFTYRTRFFLLTFKPVMYNSGGVNLTILVTGPQHFPKLPPIFKFDVPIGSVSYIGLILKWDFSISAVTINHTPKISHPYFNWYFYQNTSVCMH